MARAITHAPPNRRAVKLPKPVACPTCGLISAEIRCERCDTLKLAGCSGSCGACASKTAGACG